MRINTNTAAINAQRNLSTTEMSLNRSMSKLSSGFRINRAADDAAGLGIANVLRGDIRTMNQATRNAEQASAVLSIAEGAIESIGGMLERMKELAAQAASDSTDAAGRSRITDEYQALRSEIDRTVSTTKFRDITLLNGSFGSTIATGSTAMATATHGVQAVKLSGAAAGAYTLSSAGVLATLTNGSLSQTLGVTAGSRQTLNFSTIGISIDTSASVAAGSLQGANITVGAGSGTFLVGASDYATNGSITITGTDFDLDSSTLAISTDPSSLSNAQTALGQIDTAIASVNTALGKVGALQNRIENAASNLKTAVQNFSAAESTIRDLDMAEEMTKFSKNQILSQAGTAMLAQANQNARGVLQLLQG